MPPPLHISTTTTTVTVYLLTTYYRHAMLYEERWQEASKRKERERMRIRIEPQTKTEKFFLLFHVMQREYKNYDKVYRKMRKM